MTTEQKAQILEPTVIDAANRIKAGVLTKNVLLHIKDTTKLPETICNEILRAATSRADQFSNYKFN